MAAAYLLLAAIGAGLTISQVDPNPFVHPTPALRVAPWIRECVSCACGAGLALATVGITRTLVFRCPWAQQLHRELRPATVGLPTKGIATLALLSGVGEELFFRAFLNPLLGVLPQALLFGLAHQLPGRYRWVWMVWAAAMGLAFGGLHWALGSLSGPVLAHVLINALNLRFLRDTEPGGPTEPS